MIKGLEDVYQRCKSEGIIRKKEFVDVELAKSLMESVKEELKFYKESEKISKYLSINFKQKYDVLRQLISAFLLFDKIRVDNHQCINAYICTKHPELEIDWEILETLRILRNKICYEGKKIDSNSWKNHKIQFELHINIFLKEVKRKIDEYSN